MTNLKGEKMDWDKITKDKGYSTEKDMLKDLYVNQEWSTTEVSKLLNCSVATILDRMKRNNIKTRSKGVPPLDWDMFVDKSKYKNVKEMLEDMYNNPKQSHFKMAKKLGVSSTTLFYKMKSLEIKMRKKGWIQ